jgi:WD40 repeat protein
LVDPDGRHDQGTADAVSPLYDAFFSYATDPDRDIVREVEIFLESLGENPLVAQKYRRSLEICVDGSDFRRPRRVAEASPLALIRAYLAQSRALVVFTGPRSARHPWVTLELDWWLEHRNADPVFVVVSHGQDPKGQREASFPPKVLTEGLDANVWFDFRGARRWSRGDAIGVRSYEEERLRLAAALIGTDVSAADLIAGWRSAAAVARRRRRLINAGLGAVVAALVTIGGWFAWTAAQRARESRAAGWASLAQQAVAAGGSRTFDALVYAAASVQAARNAEGSAALVDALRLLPVHVADLAHDDGEHAADVVRLVAGDSLIVSAGYTGVLQFSDPARVQVVGRLALSGRAAAIDVDHRRNLLAIGTQKGVDLVGFAPELQNPAPRLIGRAILDQRVRSVWFEPDGRAVLYGTFEGQIGRLEITRAAVSGWQPSMSYTPTDTKGLHFAINGLAPDWANKRLAIVDIEGVVTCVDAGTPSGVVAQFRHTSEIFAVDTDVERGVAAAADADGGVLLFQPATCTVLNRVTPADSVQTVARDAVGRWQGTAPIASARTGVRLSRNGALVGVAGHEGSISVYTTTRLALVRVVPEREATRSLDFDAAGTRLVSGSDGGKLRVWDIGANAERWIRGSVGIVAPDPRGRWMAALTSDSQLELLDPKTGSSITQLLIETPAKGIISLHSSADGSHLVARAGGSTRVPFWKIDLTHAPELGQGGVLQHSNEAGQVAIVSAVATHPRGSLILTAESRDGRSVRAWNLEAGTQRFAIPFEAPVFHVAAGGETGVGADRSGLVIAFRLDGGARLGFVRVTGLPGTLAVSPDGSVFFLSVAATEGSVGLLCSIGDRFPPSSLPERVATGVRGWLQDTRVSLEASTLSSEGLVCRRLPLPDSARDAAFSPDARTLAIATNDPGLAVPGWITVLSAEVGWRGWTRRTPAAVRRLAFAPGGDVLATGQQTGGVTLWDVRSGQVRLRIPVAGPITALAFLPTDEKPLITLDGIDAGVLRFWDWGDDAVRESACRRWPPGYAVVPIPTMAAPPTREQVCGRR